MPGPIVLITGANTGLGLEIVRALAASSTAYTLYFGSRSLSKATDAIAIAKSELPDSTTELRALQVDIADDASIGAAFEVVQREAGRVDVLINNAGVSLDMEISSGTKTMRQAWNEMYDVNVTSTNILTHTFMPLLLQSTDPRLVFITSGTSSIEEATQGLPFTAAKPPAGWPKPPAFNYSGSRSSKAGMNMMMAEWGRVLKADRVKIWGVSPGFLATGLAGVGVDRLLAMGAQEPRVGAEFVRDVVEGRRDADAGKAIRVDGVQPW